MFEFECVIITRYTMHLLWRYNDNYTRLCADVRVDWIHGTVYILLALNEQEVRWYWCMLEFECDMCHLLLGIRCTYYDTIAIAHSPALQLQWQ